MQEEFIKQKIDNELIIRLSEKRTIKKSAASLGVAYILLLIIPKLCGYLFFFVTDILKIDSKELVKDAAFQHIWQISASFIMMLVPTFIFSYLERKELKNLVSLKPPKKELFLPFIFIGMGVCAFANISSSIIATFLEAFGISYVSPKMSLPEGAFGIILVIISTAITPALVEEVLARGSFLGGLKSYGEGFAILISAAAFGLMHGNIVQIPFAFMVGLILGLAVIKTGSLWTGVAIHFINNFVSVLLGDLLPLGDSVYLNILISSLYLSASLLLSFIGIMLLKGKSKDVFHLEKGELKSEFKEKMLWFCTSPMIILSIGLTVAVCAELI